MSANPFELLAESQTPAPVRRKLDKAEKRAAAAKAAEQEMKDEILLSKLYKRWKDAKRAALLAGPHGKEIKGVISFLETMTLTSAPTLLKIVDGSAWLQSLSMNERHDLLNIIGLGIARCREKAGLPPFDDGLPGEPPKAFEQIKLTMGCR